MCMKYDNYDTNFYIMCSCLLENFNNIAKIDWAKRVSLKADPSICADLFKLDENIYMAVHSMKNHTFYRNVNPIFCKNTLNEHMGINVAALFEDMLPGQDRLILQLNETKNEYEESIKKYEDMIGQLEDAKKEAATDDIKGELDAAIEDANKKLEDVKAEYKEWQKTAEEATGKEDKEEDEENDDVTKETSNEPLDADEVEDYKDELSTPLSATGE